MNWKHKVIVFIAILCASFAIHRGHLFSFPSAIHSWSQTDHLALSHGFLKNDFNFFLPETYMLNKVYETYDNTITAVDFPINNYVVAALMKATGNSSAAPFRFYMLIYSCIGLLFLFLFVHRKSGSWMLSAALVMFVFGSVVFLDYQDGLIPSISALSNVFIALYFLNLYWESNKKQWFVVALFFFSLAALVRTPYALFMIALLTEWLLRLVRKAKPAPAFELIVILFAMLLPALYFIYNAHLRTVYGTLFLSAPLPPKSMEEVSGILHNINEKWLLHYWSLGNYIALGIALLLFVFIIIKSPVKQTKQILDNRLAVWAIICVGGGSAYMLLMFHQFSQHDYYILDSLFGVVLLAFSIGVIALYGKYRLKNILAIVLMAFSIYGFVDSSRVLKLRRKHDVTLVETRAYNSYQNANVLLNRFGVQAEEKILVPDTYAPNLPLTVMERNAYSVPYPTDNTISTIKQWDWKYVLLQDYTIERLFMEQYPHFLDSLTRLGGDGKISVFTKRGTESGRDMFDLINISSKTPFFVDTSYTEWEGYTPSQISNRIGWTKSEVEYDLAKAFIETNAPEHNGIHVVAEMDYSLAVPDKEIFLTVVVEQTDGKMIDWQAVQLKDFPADNQGNRKLKKFFAVDNLTSDRKLIVSIWNPQGNEMRYENLKISLYDGAD